MQFENRGLSSIFALAGIMSVATATLTPTTVLAKRPSYSVFEAARPGASPARAKEDEEEAEAEADPPIVVGRISGANGPQIRKWIIQALNESGVPNVSTGSATKIKSGADTEDFEEAAEDDEALAILVGKVVLKKQMGFSVQIEVHNGYDGEELGKFMIRGGLLPNLKKKILGNLFRLLQKPLADAEAPEFEEEEGEEEEEVATEEGEEEEEEGEEEEEEGEEEEEEGEEEEEEGEEEEEEGEEEEEEGEEEGGKRPSPLDARLSIRMFTRSFAYTGTIAQTYPTSNATDLLTYSLAGAPAAGIHLNYYPGAHFKGGFAGNLGITAGYEQPFAMRSQRQDGSPLETASYSFYVGPRFRLPLKQHQLGVFTAFGKHEFTVNDNPELLIPDVTYSLIDIGFDSRFVFGNIGVGPYLKYRMVSNTGSLQSSDWFPNAKGAGIDIGLRGTYTITKLLEIVAGFEYLQYGFDFNPIEYDNPDYPGNAETRCPDPAQPQAAAHCTYWEQIAGGATDVYLSGYVGIGVRLPESD